MKCSSLSFLLILATCNYSTADDHSGAFAHYFRNWDSSEKCQLPLLNESPDQYSGRIFGYAQQNTHSDPANVFCLGKVYKKDKLTYFSKSGDLAANYYIAVSGISSGKNECNKLHIFRPNLLYVISRYREYSENRSTKYNYIVFPEAPYFLYTVDRWCGEKYGDEELLVLSKSIGFDYEIDKYGRGE